MPVVGAVPRTAVYPPDVLDFALRNKVDLLLDLLLAATQNAFPTAMAIRVLLESDPEIAEDRHILFEVQIPESDIPSYIDAQHRWTDELFRICPAPLVCHFRLALLPVAG